MDKEMRSHNDALERKLVTVKDVTFQEKEKTWCKILEIRREVFFQETQYNKNEQKYMSRGFHSKATICTLQFSFVLNLKIKYLLT